VDPGVDRLLGLHQALLRIGLVVERHDLDLVAENAALGVELVGQILECLQTTLADAGATAGERIDVADLEGVLSRRGMTEHRGDHGNGQSELAHFFVSSLAIDFSRWAFCACCSAIADP